MITLVTGGSKCGKSSYAEGVLNKWHGEKIYLATMQPYGEEAFAAIARHREMRRGKGFTTLEKYRDIQELVLPPERGLLLECMGNLLANEMFGEGGLTNPVDKIVTGVEHIAKTAAHLVIVTSQVGSDGISYTPETCEYIRHLGNINRIVGEMSDNVVECVYGIPVCLKGELQC